MIYKGYLLSGGNPIADVKKLLENLHNWTEVNKINLNIVASGVTGYASSILSTGFSFDTSIIETVAHMKSSVASYGEIDVICDVGGQDIKVLFMKNGSVVDFKLNTQCSAGNGYFALS